MNTPMTTTRKFDPKIWGLDKRQQVLVLILLFPLSLSFMVGCLTFGPEIGINIGVIVAILEAIFFIAVGRSSEHLYHFLCGIGFLFTIHKGDDYIYKHEEYRGYFFLKLINERKLYKKIKNLTRIVKIHDGGYIEYIRSRNTPNNVGGIGELKTYQPEDLEAFAESIEPILVGMEDKSVLITTLKVRSDLTDYAKPIREELQKNRIPQIVRDSMYEHQQMCEAADEKSYKNHMLVLNPYIANTNKAKHSLDISMDSIHDSLDELGIGFERLNTKDKIIQMFNEDLTYNTHNSEGF
jgi:hypothetical protein